MIFDLRANGQPERWAWTQAGSDDAWLVLDRNGDGVINTGVELFGNFTAQDPSSHRNGFLALSTYDDNDDGIVDATDAIFEKLRLWQDTNHDGISQAGELHVLAEFGIDGIQTNYDTINRIDEYGNIFRYSSGLIVEPTSAVGLNVFDVFLSTEKISSISALTSMASKDGVLRAAETCADIPTPIRMCRVDCYVRQSRDGAYPDPEGYANDRRVYHNTDTCDRAGNINMSFYLQPQLFATCPAYGRRYLAWNVEGQSSDYELLLAAIETCQSYRDNLASTNCLDSNGVGQRGAISYPTDNVCISGTVVSTMKTVIATYPWRP